MANVLMVIAPERFRDEELFVTADELRQAGHKILIASTKVGVCPGSRGGFATSEVLIKDVEVCNFDALVVVGGGGSKLLFDNPELAAITAEMHAAGKVIAAICLAPVVLAKAGVLKGKKATVAGTEAAALVGAGADYTGPGVMVDGLIVTANGPKASQVFGQKINALLAVQS